MQPQLKKMLLLLLKTIQNETLRIETVLFKTETKTEAKTELSLDKIIRIETDTGHYRDKSCTNSFRKMSLHDYHVLKAAITGKFVFNVIAVMLFRYSDAAIAKSI